MCSHAVCLKIFGVLAATIALASAAIQVDDVLNPENRPTRDPFYGYNPYQNEGNEARKWVEIIEIEGTVYKVDPKTHVVLGTETKLKFKDCMALCPGTNEIDPVCGSDGMSYANQEHLRCAQKCGKRVELAQRGLCGTVKNIPVVTTQTTEATVGIRGTQKFRDCMTVCPRVRHFDPVCGTDALGYDNLAHLLCAKKCGYQVDFGRRGSCKPLFNSI